MLFHSMYKGKNKVVTMVLSMYNRLPSVYFLKKILNLLESFSCKMTPAPSLPPHPVNSLLSLINLLNLSTNLSLSRSKAPPICMPPPSCSSLAPAVSTAKGEKEGTGEGNERR